MKYCKECGTECKDTAKFCRTCGKPFEEMEEVKKCNKCGTVCKKIARFCPNCGNPLEEKEQERDTDTDTGKHNPSLKELSPKEIEQMDQIYIDKGNFTNEERSILRSYEKLPEAAYHLALAYLTETEGLPVDYEKALRYGEFSARRGWYEAAYLVGKLYFEGKGTEVDLNKAFNYFLHAAKHNHAESQYEIGRYYGASLSGEEKSNISEGSYLAHQWFERAAENGHAVSMGLVASDYIEAEGCIYNLDKARYWADKGARGGAANAMYVWAYLLYKDYDYNLAGYWANEGAKRGEKRCVEFLSHFTYNRYTKRWDIKN